MKILLVIHGYPPHYMAGSEVYTFNLASELMHHAEVAVFTRVENPYEPEYSCEDSHEGKIWVRRVNKPSRDYTFRDKYEDLRMEDSFRAMLVAFNPDIVHIGHLSHLSTNLPIIASDEFKIPVVFTAHDFWMGCWRGQRVDPKLQICSGPDVDRCLACAKHYYKDWVNTEEIERFLGQMKRVLKAIDLFLAPSKTVCRFLREQGVPEVKIKHAPYGFRKGKVTAIKESDEKIKGQQGVLRFGFMGRVLPVKGIDLLIHAFRDIKGTAELNIFGDAGKDRLYLEAYCQGDARIHFCGAYNNVNLFDVLRKIDILVVPSIWLENSPLVIQEAHLARVPVIVSDAGGMAELVSDNIDGFLFPLGNKKKLTDIMQRIVDHPEELRQLRVDPGRVRSIEDDALACLADYNRLHAPERITFVTNPGLCNLSCPMCDTHSPFNVRRTEQCRELSILPFHSIEQTVRELSPLGLKEIIPSTMGEPLLYPQFEELLQLAGETGVRVNLTTNATFPKGGTAFWAERLLPVLSDVKFSLNAINSHINEQIMRGVQTEKQLENIRQFIKLRDEFAKATRKYPTVSIQMTFMRSNLESISEVLHWAIKHNVDRLKGHHLWVNWPEMADESIRDNPELKRRWSEVVCEVNHIAKTCLLPSGSQIRLENFAPLDDFDERAGQCPFLGREAWVEANGTFQVCCCPSVVRDKFGEFGDIHQKKFGEFWRSDPYREFISTWGNHENCRICNMRKKSEF